MEETDRHREQFILGVLRRLARQRVAVLLQPGDVFVLEYAVDETVEDVAEALRTCHMRGWVEPLAHSIPKGRLKPNGSLPDGPLYTHTAPFYRLTDSGWRVINKSHGWEVFACLVAVVSLFVSLASLIIAAVSLTK